MLIPSLHITNPLTRNLSPTFALLLVLGFASLFRLLQLFSFSYFGNNKKFGRDKNKRKIIFMSTRAQRRHHVSHPGKNTIFPCDNCICVKLIQVLLVNVMIDVMTSLSDSRSYYVLLLCFLI